MEEQKSQTVSEITRRNILDYLRAHKIDWAGRLSESGFLSRLYKLNELPSTDSRCENAGGDIGLHREHFIDWSDDWVYDDYRFDLMNCPDEEFLRFICEMIHPVVRSEKDEAEFLLEMFNANLVGDDWEIVATTFISKKPVYSARRRLTDIDHSISHVKEIAKGLNANYITQQITRMQTSINTDPELALGTAKELVETCCKTILTESGITYGKSVDLPKLMKLTLKELSLLPDNISEKTKGVDAIKRVLQSFSNVTQGLAELRSLYGTGHGKHGKSQAIEPRHAKLAVGAASTLAVFLFETYVKRSSSDST